MDEKASIPKTRKCLVSRSPLPSVNQVDLLALYLSLGKGVREQRFVSTAQAADIVGLSQRTIQSWSDSGKIQAIRIGRKQRICLDSLTEYLKQGNEQ